MLKHLLPADQDIQRELMRFSVDLTLLSFKEGESMVEWWGHVFDKPDKYPSLSAMVKCCLSIFHGPRVESSFSLMNDVIDQRSGNMNVSTFNAIQTVKYTLKSREKTAVQLFRREDVKFGEVDRTLCKNINSAAATYKRQQKMNQKEKQQQQSKYGSQVTGNTHQTKVQTAEIPPYPDSKSTDWCYILAWNLVDPFGDLCFESTWCFCVCVCFFCFLKNIVNSSDMCEFRFPQNCQLVQNHLTL